MQFVKQPATLNGGTDWKLLFCVAEGHVRSRNLELCRTLSHRIYR